MDERERQGWRSKDDIFEQSCLCFKPCLICSVGKGQDIKTSRDQPIGQRSNGPALYLPLPLL